MQFKKTKTQKDTASSTKPAPFYKQVWFWTLVVALIAYAGLLLFRHPLPKADNNPTESMETYPETKKHICKLGETVDANGLHITYVSAETWLPEGETAHPLPDYTFLRVKIAAENKIQEDREIYDNEFLCLADGNLETMEYFKLDRLPNGVVAPGQRVEGYVYFSVPTDAEEIELVYQSFLYWRYNKVYLPVDLPQ